MRATAGLLLAVLLALSGCQAPTTKEAIDTLVPDVRAHVQALIDADLEGFLRYIDEDWTDLGGGNKSDYNKQAQREALKEYFESDQHKMDYDGIETPDQLLEMDRISIQEYEVYMDDDERYGQAHFQPQVGDRLVSIPGLEEGPLPDGWYGYYRHTGGIWVMVAGD